ncbi:MAG: DNA-binding heavy metal response regulator [Dehalococcoidales bacterium]|nr:DNA-binding heavy metal response regulator [Dehalococcoidales bacterium]
MIESHTLKKHILVVDDEPSIRQLCQVVFTEEGFDVDTVANGKAALAMIGKQEHDLYLIDIKMPLMDGKELYQSLQKTYPRSAGRTVFMTGSIIGQDTENFFLSSGRQVLRKPFTTDELRAIVREALRQPER